MPVSEAIRGASSAQTASGTKSDSQVTSAGLRGAVIQHDGADIDGVVDAIKALRSGRHTRHRKRGVGRRSDIDAGGSNAKFEAIEGWGDERQSEDAGAERNGAMHGESSYES